MALVCVPSAVVYGITDIGDVRLAIPGVFFTGYSQSRVEIESDWEGDGGSSSGSTGSGARRFAETTRGGETLCEFGKVHFRIVDSVLEVDGQSFPIGDGPTLVVLSRYGEVLRSEDL